MLRTAIATYCLLASIAAAQSSSPGADPLSKAKTAAYLERFADEVRAKEGMEKARTALKTRKFREALAGAGTLSATAGRFFTAGGTAFVAVQVAIPSGAAKPGTSLTLFGEVTGKDGRSLVDFELRSPVLESKGDLYVEHSLLASDAAAVARVGVAKGDQVLGVAQHTLSADVASNPPSGEISQLIVSNDIFNMARKQSAFEPFAFGGTKVIPKPDRAFRAHDEAWLFVELRDPNEAAPLPRLSIRASIEGMGRTIAGTWQAAEVSPLKGVGGHFGIGTTVDLSSLKPGDYRVTLAVRDTYAKQTFERTADDHRARVGNGRILLAGVPMMMDPAQIVHSNPEILGGTPVFVGTRVPVQTLLVYLEKGETLEEFLDNFPTVSREQAIAFLEAAGRALLAQIA